MLSNDPTWHWHLHIDSEFFQEVGDLQTPVLLETENGGLLKTQRSMLRTYPIADGTSGCDELASVPAIDDFMPLRGLVKPLICLAARKGIQIPNLWAETVPWPYQRRSEFVNPSVAGFISRNISGIIELGDGVATSEIIADVCRAFPEFRVLVLGPHAAPLSRICRAVRSLEPNIDAVDVSSRLPSKLLSREEEDPVRVVFARYQGIRLAQQTGCGDGITVDARFRIVICLQPEHVRGHKTTDFLDHPESNFRCFGILCGNRLLPPDEEDQIVNVFGVDRIRIPASGHGRTALNWVSIRNEKRPDLYNEAAGAAAMLRQLQQCHHRNTLIAKLAKSLTGPECGQIGGQIGGWCDLLREDSRPPSVVIVTAGDTQTACLRSLLPVWKVFGEEATCCGPAAWSTDPSTVTPPAANGIICPVDDVDKLANVFDPAVIINAVGGPHPLPLPQGWLQYPISGGVRNRRLILDLHDRANRQTKRWSSARFDAYEKNAVYRFVPGTSNKQQFSDAVMLRFLDRTARPAVGREN